MQFLPQSTIRAKFARSMSDMYQKEVPLYGDLQRVVKSVNEDHFKAHPELEEVLGNLDRVSEERHGAIRLGLPEEMHTMAKLFKVMGMYPVDYYDLTLGGLPVHSTVFRPIGAEELAINPFRVFTSLLRLDLLDDDVRERAEAQLKSRQIFTDKALEIIKLNEEQGGLTEPQVDEFINEALETFRWRDSAAVSKEFYDELLEINGLVADIVGFQNPHINHLTPRVLDIDELYRRMAEDEGITMIPAIQGPPNREADILLRQTSFQALKESTHFPDDSGGSTSGEHRARFGEIEQRGVALTPKGRELYDKLILSVQDQAKQSDPHYKEVLEKVFADFPDGYEALRKEGLAYFRYYLTDEGLAAIDIKDQSLDALVDTGYVSYVPITYEDFLPISAAGIFRSNLVEGGDVQIKEGAQTYNKQLLADTIGMEIYDPFAIYENEQKASIKEALEQLAG